jgi:hypothetical protein
MDGWLMWSDMNSKEHTDITACFSGLASFWVRYRGMTDDRHAMKKEFTN